MLLVLICKEYKVKGIDLLLVVFVGLENLFGDYVMCLVYGFGEYLIYGINKDFGVGMRVSVGCICMDLKDIEWFY